MLTHRIRNRAVVAAALAAAVQMAAPAFGGQTAGFTTISFAGSTALKNWFVKNTTTFTDVQPDTTLSIDGQQYPPASAGGVNDWSDNGGSALLYQLAPSSASAAEVDTGVAQQAPALRFEYHESGSVEGILEMASDQIAPVSYVSNNIDRNPSTGTNAGNGVWVNYNEFGGGKNNWTAAGAIVNGFSLGDFYANGATFSPNLGAAAPEAAFDANGNNLNGGQNAVQVALSDVVPIQGFVNTYASPSTAAAEPWFSTPQNYGYGQGNTLLPAATANELGTPGIRTALQDPSVLNMPAGATNPRGGTVNNGVTQPATFGVGPWNNASDGGLGNLDSQLGAITATMFVANPGTGLTELNQTDAQLLQTTGRLGNGAAYNMTTRDVNSGTHNVAAQATGIDPSFAVGVNDDGDGNLSKNAFGTALNESTLGPQLRFSNKTAGGAQLRPTVQIDRMAVGTLSINDANGTTFSSSTNPLRALEYSNTVAGQTLNPVLASYQTIINGTYVIFQNEQFVTLQAPDANYGTANPDFQGDDATGDVKALLANTVNSVAASAEVSGNPANPAGGLEAQGYIPPQYMQVEYTNYQTGTAIVPNTVANGFAAADAYNPDLPAPLSALTSPTGKMGNSDPSTVTSGSTSSVYGGNANNATVPGIAANNQIDLTSSNYLFANFNQTGVYDFDSAVVEAQKAQAALFASGDGESMFSGALNATKVTTGIVGTDAMQGQTGSSGTTSLGASKGDLIVMGDFNGDGSFTGADLYQMAISISLSSPTDRPTETTVDGVTTFTTGDVIVPVGENFGQVIDTSVLNKNVALDYLQANATAQQKIEAQAVLSGATVPSGATDLGTTDPVTGLEQYTYDPTGANSFNKSDVNHDGVVDFNDAVLVDKFNGTVYNDQGTPNAAMDQLIMANQIQATEQAPVTGTIQPANLELIGQVDNSTTIGSADLAVVNSALTGTGNANWYGYNLQKTGPGTITWARTGGTVIVYPGASFEISAGTVQVGGVSGTIDPFSDNTGSAATGSDHVTVTVDHGAELQLLDPVSFNTVKVGGLSIDTASGSKVDVSDNNLDIVFGSNPDPVSTIRSYLLSGYNSGAWNGPGIDSSSAAASSGKFAVGYVDAGDSEGVAGEIQTAYTLVGDTNLDGTVNLTDLLGLLNSYGLTGQDWAHGDFNYDGTVNLTDLLALLNNYGLSGGNVATSIPDSASISTGAVPEPASASLLMLGAGALLARRRRNK